MFCRKITSFAYNGLAYLGNTFLYYTSNFTGDLYNLKTNGGDFIAGEIYDRAARDPGGVGIANVGCGKFSRPVVFVLRGDAATVKIFSEYGNTPATVTDPAARKPFDIASKATGADSVANWQGDKAMAERQRIKPHFSGPSLVDLFHDANHYMSAITSVWQLEKTLQQNVSHYAMNMIFRQVFGLSHIEFDEMEPFRQMGDMLAHNDSSSAAFFACKKAMSDLNEKIIRRDRDYIQQQKKMVWKQLDADVKRTPEEMLQALIKTKGASGIVVENNMSALITAGLAWITTHKNVLEKLREEIQQLENTEAKTAESQLQLLLKSPYLNQVFKETQRLLSPTALVPRQTSRDYIFQTKDDKQQTHTYRMPAGSMMFVPIRRIHLDPAFWENPLEFNPSRFEKVNMHYMPFSEGNRACMARGGVAEIIAKVAWVTILGKFDLTLNREPEQIPVESSHPRLKDFHFTLTPRENGLNLTKKL